MAPLIEFRNVSKSFAFAKALDDLSLTVESGSIYGLLGRNGAGKTTALRMLAGLDDPTSGEVLVFGKTPGDLDDLDKANIGYAGAGQVIPPYMTVAEVCDTVRRAAPRWDDALCRTILDEGRIEPTKRVRALSRGMKQRLRLALAYAKRPKVLIFDEPAEGLDTIVRYGLFARVLDVVAQGDSCAIVSSHVLADVERVADRIGFLSSGKLLVDGPLDDMKDRFRRVRIAWPESGDPGQRLESETLAEGSFSFRRDGRQASFITGRYDDAWLAAFKRKFPSCMVEIDPLDLEGIFIEILGDES